MRRIFAVFLTMAFGLQPIAAAAGCEGANLLDTLVPGERAALEAASARHPYAEGRIFEVEREGKVSTLFGTMHLTDPEIATPPEPLRHRIEAARVVMIEITADGMAEMKAEMMADPTILIAGDGARLRPTMSEAEWARLGETLAAYGIPAAVADRMAPWFLLLTLSMPACLMQAEMAGEEMLDRRIERLAEAAGVPVAGLEDWKSLFGIMSEGSHAEQAEMLRLSLPALGAAEDALATSRELYLQGRIMMIWELGQLLLEREMPGDKAREIMAANAEALLVRRNALWMERLVPELGRGGAVVAVGALHLGGEDGLLRLLEREGFSIRRLDG